MLLRGLTTLLLSECLLGMPAAAQGAGRPELNKIPKKVMDALKARFPKAVIHKWTRENEGGIVLHDVEFTQEGRKFEADIREDGTIDNWEKQIPATDLPAAVRKAVTTRYPKAAFKEVMAMTAVKNGKDVPEGYEIVLQTAGEKEFEISVAPDGKFLEDSGQK